MINLIPKPAFCEERFGEFTIASSTTIYSDGLLVGARDLLVDLVQKVCGFKLNIIASSATADICLFVDRKQPREGYSIDCSIDRLEIRASTKIGGFYAIQSIRQLTLIDIVEDVEVLSMHAVKIIDYPKYAWRGIMLDESRYFFGPEVVKGILDMMALHKLNVFHWHLTDNNGWRIEIKKYPKLTQIGGTRRGSQALAWGKKEIDWSVHEGYYTQEEIAEIVSYAENLNIMVVPEVDMPAHLASAIAAYPELGCFNKKIEPFVLHAGNNHGELDIIGCAGKETTYKFIYDIIDELSKLFPAPYFHIGGDEAPKTEWKKCPLCQKTIEENKLLDEEGLQGFFNNKVAVYLKRKGKRMIGWNEILKADNLENSIIAQYWTHKADGKVAEWLAGGHNVIISKHESFYIDMPHVKVKLKDVYEFSLENLGFEHSFSEILGVEAPLWTEWVPTQQRLEFQLYPRMEALAEVAWSPDDRMDYKDFLERLEKFLPILKKRGIVYCPLHMADGNRCGNRREYFIFLRKNAHYEYYKALAYRKRRGW